MYRFGKFIHGFDPDVRKHLELRFALTYEDYNSPSESKEIIFPVRECLFDEFPD